MSELDEILTRLLRHDGVEQVVLLGRDGLVVRRLGDSAMADPDMVAAMTPGVVSACANLGRAGAQGAFSTAVMEFAGGVAIVADLSADLLLLLALRPGIGFAELLRELRRERDRLARAV